VLCLFLGENGNRSARANWKAAAGLNQKFSEIEETWSKLNSSQAMELISQ